MLFKEVHGDLFSAPTEYKYAQCIASDGNFGGGIAPQFQARYNIRPIIKALKPRVGDAVYTHDKVFNLITKERTVGKPTYLTLRKSLISMKDICLKKDIKKIAIPKIGCGLDKLDWDEVKKIINTIFSDTDIEIIAYLRD
jgi:O-acetyl-ADP-ribose deacetylase (regulator of RNase III)